MAGTYTRATPSGPGTAGERVAQARLPGIILTFVLILLLPIEFSVSLGSIFLPPTRLFFLIAALPP